MNQSIKQFSAHLHFQQFCVQEANSRQFLLDPTGRTQPYSILVGAAEGAKKFVRWMMHSSRLAQFTLAKRLLYASE
jgi:hypothetical protein